MFINIAFNIPQDKLFTYEVPPTLEKKVQIGKRVFVPFGHKKRTGFIVSTTDTCVLSEIKLITEVLDDEPLFDQSDLDFYRWVAHYYMYPLGKTLAEIIPSGAGKKDITWIIPVSLPENVPLTRTQEKILSVLNKYPQGMSINSLSQECKLKNISAAVRRLHLLGLLRIEERQKKQLGVCTEKMVLLSEDKITEAKLTARQKTLVNFLQKHGSASIARLIKATGVSPAVVNTLHKKGLLTFKAKEIIRRAPLASLLMDNPNSISLNKEQKQVLAEISSFLGKNAFTPILLHGVTGSGKTEIYLKAIEEVLKNGETAIYLVPEIALTPQLIARISGRFSENKIAVLHSRIAQSIRYDQWRQIKRGDIQLVIGARSAIFAPLPNLKLIIVDEEHDSSYKQNERLHYHARDAAVVKAKMNRAVVILGSATPSIRSYFNAQTKKYQHMELTHRVLDRPLPIVEIIDMKEQKEKQGKLPLLSDQLISAVAETLNRKEQVLLFLNRRGFNTFLVCADCGYNFRCPNCAVSLKHHLAENVIKCHYCSFSQKALPICPFCKGSRILSYGAGTQKLEKEIARLFPEARLQRMDSDTSSHSDAQENILSLLEKKNLDILVGTQMITKGHDFPWITLVGVITADTSLNMPDFRAAEKTLQLLTQVAGRGGRGENPGKVIIQTFNPEHYALLYTKYHDYKSFYREEMGFRQSFKYPPVGCLINIHLSSIKKDVLNSEAEKLKKNAKAICRRYLHSVEIIGPAPAPLAKLNGRFRFQMLIKGANSSELRQIVQELLQNQKSRFVKTTVDVDPENFM